MHTFLVGEKFLLLFYLEIVLLLQKLKRNRTKRQSCFDCLVATVSLVPWPIRGAVSCARVKHFALEIQKSSIKIGKEEGGPQSLAVFMESKQLGEVGICRMTEVIMKQGELITQCGIQTQGNSFASQM